VVTRPQWILGWIYQGQHALLLVIMQKMPRHRQAGAQRYQHAQHDAPGQAGKKQHIKTRCGNQQRSTQIGLFGDQRHRDREQQRSDAVILETQGSFVMVKIPGQASAAWQFS